ncbi:cardiomyopathy-associated protein 5 [Pungitius pungitius]|uniref:cardiomyopathy-associated protein 5 n=1 Tax=Pungitius pungitius TaxID=134920 RepID=UPI002E15D66B
MDTPAEDVSRVDVDAEMRAMTPEEIAVKDLEAGDEVETLRNSLREAVHDDNVRPKMQCLMMDSSFSMVTMQGEDSGIAWETTPSRCATPWGSEPGTHGADPGCAAPGSAPAGKIIFIMDEELLSRRKKSKERADRKSKAAGRIEVLGESSENVSGRPELVEVSRPNVKPEDGDEEEAPDPLVDKEQRLFSLVSEGSEILNIVVPPKLATVDEEESKEMVDNLSYLEESVVRKGVEEGGDSDPGFAGSGAARGDPAAASSSSAGTNVTDPPGAPVTRPRGAAGNVDYFEAFALIDAEAPGSPAVAGARAALGAGVAPETRDALSPSRPEGDNAAPTATTATVDDDMSDTVSLAEITSELLDEVFYGGTGSFSMKPVDKDDGRGAPSRFPSKPSGSTLFGSQEDVLTPIFLPDGPPKIIDQILLEEPKAMPFLYTDLYEEAVGSRKKEEDTESMTSEKSFHSRHSDREARGYLEKYVLMDDTPVPVAEPSDQDESPEEGPRVLAQDLYDFGDLLSAPEEGEMPDSEEEITDFFRSSANASPLDVEPFPRSLEEDEPEKTANLKKGASVALENVAKIPVDQLGVSSFEFLREEPDWGGADEHHAATYEKAVGTVREVQEPDLETPKPVAPARRKVTPSPKACLDLTPLTPVDVIPPEEAGGKEHRVEEKETASPAEAANEGDEEEAMRDIANVALLQSALDAMETPQSEGVRDPNPAADQERDSGTLEGMGVNEREEAPRQTEPERVDVKSTELVHPEKRGGGSAEPAKDKGQCVIL